MNKMFCIFALVMSTAIFGCTNKETKVVTENGKAVELQIKGNANTIKVETVEIDGVEYLVLHDEYNQRFAICPKVNGKHAK